LNKEVAFAGVEGLDVNMPFFSAWPRPHFEKDLLGSGKDLWKAMTDLAILSLELRDLLGLSSRCSDPP
jgi:hypothetical protein